jgi:hypothetical protein
LLDFKLIHSISQVASQMFGKRGNDVEPLFPNKPFLPKIASGPLTTEKRPCSLMAMPGLPGLGRNHGFSGRGMTVTR